MSNMLFCPRVKTEEARQGKKSREGTACAAAARPSARPMLGRQRRRPRGRASPLLASPVPPRLATVCPPARSRRPRHGGRRPACAPARPRGPISPLFAHPCRRGSLSSTRPPSRCSPVRAATARAAGAAAARRRLPRPSAHGGPGVEAGGQRVLPPARAAPPRHQQVRCERRQRAEPRRAGHAHGRTRRWPSPGMGIASTASASERAPRACDG
ncbi:hypothetical protein PVAP13_7KG121911 [Panicum virgatum]|uniref:Uncharacterized protein n=1 Tax=Panicum virgatum TaxID=38727 RepID=A0A8T0QEM4_PANVG|nr:hypothetical protein PVAP13_7KG121911 [Panicum virgatum]